MLTLFVLLALATPTARDRVDAVLTPTGPILFPIYSYLTDDPLYPPVFRATGRGRRVLELRWGGCEETTPGMVLTIPGVAEAMGRVGFTAFRCVDSDSGRRFESAVQE